MSLFQPSVLKGFLILQEKEQVKKAYKKYASYFLNVTIQDNIRNSKEEEYQGIFLTELFVNILDYTLKPNVNFNLVAEYKNQTNSRKADGAILHNDIATAVIELKGTNTKDLESIRKQAFDYKVNQKGCVYVVTSNYEKLRFYINDATEFEEFNLFDLTQERFELLFLCLQKDSIINDIPLKIKEASIVKEELITKEFYKDYSFFKRELYRDLVKRNAKRIKAEKLQTNNSNLTDEEIAEVLQLEKNVKLTLFKKSQKLIDRFLFIFFAEDRNLLTANSTELILAKWKSDIDFGDERPLYSMFKQYFHFLDKGRQGTKSRGEIYAYNGGLFKEDALLDALEIDSDLLYKHTRKLATYDFESQVDVNILGHIFENSLNEIESVNAEIEGSNFDKQKSKRKKDGVFYTPKYITKYIVENTVGKLCLEKKEELGIKEEEYFKGRKNRNKSTITHLVILLDEYRAWLLQLTICDPACGSGAFLNQALDFLIKEHAYIDELKTKVLGGGITFSGIENTILENNIFGVDLNEESVEIAKLSLWLRTAQPRRKLNDLSSNIKCGNSLIDSKAVAGDKAFHWQNQFPQVFDKGGFDVIIGNPPYGAELDIKSTNYIEKNFKSFEYQVNTYVIFYEQGINLLKNNGILGYITPATFSYQHYFKKIRSIINRYSILSFVKYYYEVFDDADIGDGVTLILSKVENTNKNILVLKCINKQEAETLNPKIYNQKDLVNNDGTYNLNESDLNIQKLLKKGKPLGDLTQIIVGIKPYQTNKGKPKQTKQDVEEKKFTSTFKKDETFVNCVIGKDFNRYRFLQEPEMFLSFGEWLAEPRNIAPFYDDEKIIIRQTSDTIIATIDNKKRINLNNVYNVKIPQNMNGNYLLGILNSKLIKIIYQSLSQEKGRIFPEVKKVNLFKIPIIVKNNYAIIQNVENILSFYKVFNKINLQFQNYLSQKFNLKNLTPKLQNWQELSFGDFIKELNKAIETNNKLRVKESLQKTPTLTKKDEFEWLELFEENKQKAQELQQQISQTDKEIDQMVYKLYGLSEEEIEIVENS